MTKSVTIEIADEVLSALNMSPEEFAEEARALVAIKLHEMGGLSGGAAAELAGMPKPLFLTKLSRYGVDPFDLDEDELPHDLASAERHS